MLLSSPPNRETVGMGIGSAGSEEWRVEADAIRSTYRTVRGTKR